MVIWLIFYLSQKTLNPIFEPRWEGIIKKTISRYCPVYVFFYNSFQTFLLLSLL
jgi:hypothetical protein